MSWPPPSSCPHEILAGEPGQPSGGLSIFRGVQLPTETLPTGQEATQRVSVLFQTHALALKKLAFLMTGDQSISEDIVQDAFLGLYRRWRSLDDADKALGYLRISVLNGCRSVHRVRFRRQGITLDAPEDTASAEDLAILGEANRQVLLAIRRLPARQREAVVLRYYLDMTEDQAAQAMGVSRGTVKSATSRGLAALARMLEETK
jgi:RNA polymerase sigma-70 factor (sigma-E family)